MPKAARKRSSALSKNKHKRDDGKSILPKIDGKSVGREASVVGLTADHGKTDHNQHPSSSPSSISSLTRQPNSTIGESPAISRGQRKRLIKREKYLQRERMVMSSLKLRKQDEQAKRIDGLDALKEALLETVTKMPESQEEKTRPAQVVRSNRGKRSIVKKEVEHMKLVLEHPSFKANPLAAIHEHLTNTTSKQATTAEDQSKPVPVKAKPAKKKKSRFRATRMKNR
jgi:Ribosome biogenesis protein SLX9